MNSCTQAAAVHFLKLRAGVLSAELELVTADANRSPYRSPCAPVLNINHSLTQAYIRAVAIGYVRSGGPPALGGARPLAPEVSRPPPRQTPTGALPSLRSTAPPSLGTRAIAVQSARSIRRKAGAFPTRTRCVHNCDVRWSAPRPVLARWFCGVPCWRAQVLRGCRCLSSRLTRAQLPAHALVTHAFEPRVATCGRGARGGCVVQPPGCALRGREPVDSLVRIDAHRYASPCPLPAPPTACA